MKNTEELFSVGTTFNKRLYEDKHCEIVKSMFTTYPNMDFYVFHENSFEKEKYNEEVVIKEKWDKIYSFDLFELNSNWLKQFLENSPFKDSHIYGTPATFDPPHYWKRNGIFWFRKVVALNSCKNLISTPFLIWTGCDVYWLKKIDDPFIEWVTQFDVCHIDREKLGFFTETDIIVFNMKRNGKYFIERYLDFYTSNAIFELERWDDCVAFDATKHYLEKEGLTFGSLLDKTGCPFNVYDYLYHHKNPLYKVRDIKRGI